MIEAWDGLHPHHSHDHGFTAFPSDNDPTSTSVASGAKAGSVQVTGKALTTSHKDELPNPSSSYSLFRQYSWQPSSKFHKLLRELWKYIQSIEDEHYQLYYKGNINEETLRDYSSAIQEIIPRFAKVQSILNHNARGFPDMMRWKPPTAEPLHTKAAVRHGAQDCQEFAVLARSIANKKTPISSVAAGAIIQGALACQAAASKAAIALQRAKFGDPVCDPATVIAGFGNSLNTVAVIIECDKQEKHSRYSRFL